MKTPRWIMVTALIAFVMVFGLDKISYCEEQGVQVLTRGPVHEAFANIVAFNPEPGIIVPKAPPELIEEVLPDERPAGANVAWISGYWTWDDERNDFLWVSGVWRVLPPGRQWVAGYWGQSDQGYQWISGYWADSNAGAITYLPAPPASLEVSPNIAAPSQDYFWEPGYWVWYQGRYAWHAGSWVVGRSHWVWYPASYIWTPRGYVFVDGYWDYSVDRRGVLFAPVYFEPGVYSRRDYRYSPNIAIDLAGFLENLFLRPSYHQYYFGDYYADSYRRSGFYASYSSQSRRYGYDSVYEQQRWDHRQDHQWQQNVETTYQYRLNNETARPPRTWAAQSSLSTSAQSRDRSLVIATSLDQLKNRTNSPLRLQPVANAEKQQIVQRVQAVRKSRDDRKTRETKQSNPSAPIAARIVRSPIVTQPSVEQEKNQPKPQTFTTQQNINKINRPSPAPAPERIAKPVAVQHEVRRLENRPIVREVQQAVAEQRSKHVQHEAKPVKNQPAVSVAQPEPAPPAIEKKSKKDKDSVQNENQDENQKVQKNKKGQ